MKIWVINYHFSSYNLFGLHFNFTQIHHSTSYQVTVIKINLKLHNLFAVSDAKHVFIDILARNIARILEKRRNSKLVDL